MRIKNIIKLFVLILVIKTNFLVSFAFIGDDLGLDLYKNIDSGIGELTGKQYSYELKGGDEGSTIADKINAILNSKNLGDCKISSSINENEISEIVYGKEKDIVKSGNIGLLSKKLDISEELKAKCLSIKNLNQIHQVIVGYAENTKKKAKEKTEQIYNIAKIGLFSDGSVENSPFDIIKDIKDIDYIVFTQELNYEGGQYIGDDFFKDYLKGEIEDFGDNSNGGNGGGGGGDGGAGADGGEGSDGGKGKSNGTDEDNDNSINNVENHILSFFGEDTSLICLDSQDESGLSKNDINNIINGDINGKINKNFIENNNTGDFSFSTSSNPTLGSLGINIGSDEYIKINDNEYWGGNCDTFFCIEVEFMTHKGDLLGYSKTRSIESLLKRSNEHLKKFANSSLIQAKMTTNNFESIFRDLDLSEIFSMPIVITRKTPPILNLQGLNDEVFKSDENKEEEDTKDILSAKNLLKARFQSIGMNVKRENDLSIYYDTDAKSKSIYNSTELNISNVTQKYVSRKDFYEKALLLTPYLDNVINSQGQSNDTDILYEEFLELELFTNEVMDYTDTLYKSVVKMIAIPIHP